MVRDRIDGDLDAAKLDDVREWFRTYYGPKQRGDLLAGDITRNARRSGTVLGTSLRPPHGSRTCGSRGGGLASRSHAGSRCAARIYKDGTSRIRLRDGDYLDCNRRARGGKNVAALQTLVYDEQVATDVAAYVDLGDRGSSLVRATAKPGATSPRVERAIDAELARFIQSADGEQLRRVKTQSRANFIRRHRAIGASAANRRAAVNEVSPAAPTTTSDAAAHRRHRRRPRWLRPLLTDGDWNSRFVLSTFETPRAALNPPSCPRRTPPERASRRSRRDAAERAQESCRERHSIPQVT